MKVYAHRGACGTHPENTLAAFREALRLRADGIELDVHATADRVPIVIHDRALDRTTSGSGDVDRMSLADLRRLDAGAGERVPTLAEVLALIADRAHLDIEIKGHDIEPEVLEVLSHFPETRWAISSFDWQTLRHVRQLDPHAELWPLATEVDEAVVTTAHELGSPAVSLAVEAYTPRTAAKLRQAELAAVIWTVNDFAAVRRVRDLGAAAVCTDVPGRILEALRGH